MNSKRYFSFILFILWISNCWSEVLYISQEGNDSFNCTLEFPCASIDATFNRITEPGSSLLIIASATPYTRCNNYIYNPLQLTIGSYNGIATVDCGGEGYALLFESDGGKFSVTLENLVFKHAAISNSSIRNSNIGAVSLVNLHNATVQNCSFESNHLAGKFGGAILFFDVGTVEVVDSVFINNTAWYGGGAVYVVNSNYPLSNLTVFNCVFMDNVGTSYFSGGGAVFVHLCCNISSGSSNHIQFERNEFVRNVGYYLGGAVGVWYLFSNPTMFIEMKVMNNTFANNIAELGGGFGVFNPGDTQVFVENLKFVGNTFEYNWANKSGGGVFLNSRPVTRHLGFANNTFFSNRAGQLGGALFVDPAYPSCRNCSTVIHVQNDLFEYNSVDSSNSMGSGGAAVFGNYDDVETQNRQKNGVFNCTYDGDFQRWQYNSYLQFSSVSFINNTIATSVGSGGALVLINGFSEINNCTFVNNNGVSEGGAMHVQGTATCHVTNSIFDNNMASTGQHWFSVSQSGAKFINSTFQTPSSDGTIFLTSQGGNTTFINVNFLCPEGMLLMTDGTQVKQAEFDGKYCKANLHQPNIPFAFKTSTVVRQCKLCDSLFYMLDNGAEINSTVVNPLCLPCPYGADCTNGGSDVQSLPGFWCNPVSANSTKALKCWSCPSYYCCPDHLCPWNDSCVGYRSGILCGSCKEGFSEAFGTNQCIPVSKCSGLALMLVLAIILIISIIYILFLLFTGAGSSPYWKSTTYFLQVLPLLLLPNPTKSTGHGTISKIIQILLGIFGLDLGRAGIDVFICPLPGGMNGVQKIASSYAIPFVLLTSMGIVVAVILLKNSLQRIISRKHTFINFQEPIRRTSSKLLAKCSGTLISLLLLAYNNVTGTTFTLIQCVPIEDVGLVLFLSGDIHCYNNWWQIMAIIVALIILTPFPLWLALFRLWLHPHKKVNSNLLAMKEILEQPFQKNCLWWESILMLRRLVLIALYTFTFNPLWRSLSLCLACMVILAVHLHFKPYRNKWAESVETTYLLSLVLVSIVQIPTGTLVSSGTVDTSQLTPIVVETIQTIFIAVALGYFGFVFLYDRTQSRCCAKKKLSDDDPVLKPLMDHDSELCLPSSEQTLN